MIYRHQVDAIAYITGKFLGDPEVAALLISGSISHGLNDENSDVDLNIVVSDELYRRKESEHALTFWESAEAFYPGGYFDGKYITLGYLALVAEKGNEPTRFALRDCIIAFDKTGCVRELLEKIGQYNLRNERSRTTRFLAQLEAWRWYCGEALRRDNKYLLDVSVPRLILFAGRLILLHNRMFFPYHKWFLRVLEDAPDKPPELMAAIFRLLDEKTAENIESVYTFVTRFKDWTGGEPYSWSSHFVYDTETCWMRDCEYIENI